MQVFKIVTVKVKIGNINMILDIANRLGYI